MMDNDLTNTDIRELINPHDKIFLSCDDIDAARLAVIVVGHGAYAIEGDDMPLLLFGGSSVWSMEAYGMPFEEWAMSIETPRLIAALESFRLEGERSSTINPVGRAHEIAKNLRAQGWQNEKTT